MPTRQGHKKETTYGFLLLVNFPLSLGESGADQRPATAAKKGNGRGFFLCYGRTNFGSVLFFYFFYLFAGSDTLLLHMWFHLRRRDITVSRNSFARCYGQFLRILHIDKCYLHVLP